MTPFDWCVIRQLTVGTIFVTAGFTGVLWLSQSLRFVDLIVNRGLQTGTFLQLIALLLPNFVVLILPIAFLAAVLFTYARLIGDREMTVLSAVGISPLGLAKPALLVAVAITGLGYYLFFDLVPYSYRAFRELQWNIRFNLSHLLLEEGAFTDVGESLTVYVRERAGHGELLGILVHDNRENGNPYTLMAERGVLQHTADGARVVLFNGSRQQVDRSNNSFSILHFDRYAFDLAQVKEDKAKRYRDPRERGLDELFDIRNDPLVPPRDYGKFIVEGHRRLVQPLTALGYALVGLACLLALPFRRGNQTKAVVAAIVAVAAVTLVTLSLENVAPRNLGLVPMLYVMALAPIVGGGFFLIRPLFRRRGLRVAS
jgi:lipopolysaccharide export system permease protein